MTDVRAHLRPGLLLPGDIILRHPDHPDRYGAWEVTAVRGVYGPPRRVDLDYIDLLDGGEGRLVITPTAEDLLVLPTAVVARCAYAVGLRALADLLDSCPEVDLPDTGRPKGGQVSAVTIYGADRVTAETLVDRLGPPLVAELDTRPGSRPVALLCWQLAGLLLRTCLPADEVAVERVTKVRRLADREVPVTEWVLDDEFRTPGGAA